MKLSNLFNKKDYQEMFMGYYVITVLIKAVIFNTLFNILFNAILVKLSTYLFIFIIGAFVQLYAIKYIFIDTFKKAYDLTKKHNVDIDDGDLKNKFLYAFNISIILYFIITIIPYISDSLFCLVYLPGFTIEDKYLISTFKTIITMQNISWIATVCNAVKNNYHLIKLKGNITANLLLIIAALLFVMCSYFLTYEKYIIATTLQHQNTVPKDLSNFEAVTIPLTSQDDKTTYIYSQDLMYIVDTKENILYELDTKTNEKEPILNYSIQNTSSFNLEYIDITYRSQDKLFFHYPSDNYDLKVSNEERGLYSIDIATGEINRMIDDIHYYNMSGGKQSNTFDYIAVGNNRDYYLSSFDYNTLESTTHMEIKLDASETYDVKKCGDKFYTIITNYTTKASDFYLEDTLIYTFNENENVSYWIPFEDSIIILGENYIYKIFNDQNIEPIKKSIDIYTEPIFNRFFFDPNLKNYNPVMSEMSTLNYMINAETLDIIVLNDATNKDYLFDLTGNHIEIYFYNDEYNLVYSPESYLLQFTNSDYTKKKPIACLDGFLEFDINNQPYLVRYNKVIKLHP